MTFTRIFTGIAQQRGMHMSDDDRQPSFTTFGILGSVIFYTVFILLLVFGIFHLLFPDRKLVYTASVINLVWLILPTVLIIVSGLFYIRRSLYRNPDYFLSYKHKKLQSAAACILLIAATAAFLYFLIRSTLPHPIRIYICIATLFFASFSHFQLLHFFVYFFLIRLFRNTLNLSEIISHHSTTIRNIDHFLVIHSSVINRCKRSGDTLVITGFTIGNSSWIRERYGTFGISQIMRQIDFILTEHSRNYEPWGIVPDHMLFVNFFQIGRDDDPGSANDRFSSILSHNEFVILESVVEVHPLFCTLSVPADQLPSAVFESDEKEYLNKQINRLIDCIKLSGQAPDSNEGENGHA